MNDGSVFLVVKRKSVAVSCARARQVTHSPHVLIPRRPWRAARIYLAYIFAVIPLILTM